MEIKTQSVTMEMVAKHAGVSRGTVDRVINKRGKVKDYIEERVQNSIKALNYTPNKLASALSYSNNIKRVLVLYQYEQFLFHTEINKGIERAVEEVKDFGIEISSKQFNSNNISELLEIMNTILELNFDAVALCAPNDDKIVEKIDFLVDNNIDVITFNSDIPKSKRLSFVGQDLFKSGLIAGDIISRVINQDYKLLIGCGFPDFDAHQRRIDGFTYAMKKNNFNEDNWINCRIFPDYNATYQTLKYTLSQNEVDCIYMSIGNYFACADVVKELNLQDKIFIVIHDYNEKIDALLKEGVVSFSIDQDLSMQSYKSIMLLKDLLRFNIKPEPEYLDKPMKIISSACC